MCSSLDTLELQWRKAVKAGGSGVVHSPSWLTVGGCPKCGSTEFTVTEDSWCYCIGLLNPARTFVPRKDKLVSWFMWVMRFVYAVTLWHLNGCLEHLRSADDFGGWSWSG